AREVALEQGLEHQNQRIALHAFQLLLKDVARDPVLLYEWNAHSFSLFGKKVSDTSFFKGRLTPFFGRPTPFGSPYPSVPVRSSIASRKLRRMCAHSILNHGVNRSGALLSSASSASMPTQRQSATSLTLASTRPSKRPYSAKQYSCSAPRAPYCAWYWNLYRHSSGHVNPSSCSSRRETACSSCSPQRGCEQHVFDQ